MRKRPSKRMLALVGDDCARCGDKYGLMLLPKEPHRLVCEFCGLEHDENRYPLEYLWDDEDD